MTTQIFELEIDSIPYLEEGGIGVSTFVGNGEEDPVDNFYSWEALINQELDSVTVRQVAFPKDDEYGSLDRIRSLIADLRAAADKAEERINGMFIFDREAWNAAGGEYEQFMDYCTPIKEAKDD